MFYPSKVEHTRKNINRTLFSEISERKYHLIYQTMLIYSPFYTAREILERYHVFYLSCNIVSYFPHQKIFIWQYYSISAVETITSWHINDERRLNARSLIEALTLYSFVLLRYICSVDARCSCLINTFIILTSNLKYTLRYVFKQVLIRFLTFLIFTRPILIFLTI